MSGIGYGNHDTSPPGEGKVGERASPDAASAKPGAGATDRPGMDLGGAGDPAAMAGATAGQRSNPESGGDHPHAPGNDTSPRVTADIGRDSTPGEGASAKEAQGDEVDPGVG